MKKYDTTIGKVQESISSAWRVAVWSKFHLEQYLIVVINKTTLDIISYQFLLNFNIMF